MARLLVVLALLVGAVAQAEVQVVAVGVESYDDPEVSRVRCAALDAEAVAQAFERAGVPAANIALLSTRIGQRPPTKANVLTALGRARERAVTGDDLVVFFAGHGVEIDGVPYLLTSDVRRDALEDLALPMSAISRALRGFQGRQVLLLVDACRNDPRQGRGDADAALTDGLARGLRPMVAGPGTAPATVATLLACDVGERAWEMPEENHGAFTYFLLQGLDGAAADAQGDVRVGSLARYVTGAVKDWGARARRPQNPRFENPNGVDFVLSRATVRQPPPPSPGDVTAMAPVTPTPPRPGEITVYVSPQGNDAASGRRAEPGGADGPVATLARARDVLRQLRQEHGAGTPLRAVVAGGIYRLTEPLVFGPQDGGPTTMPVIWEPAPGTRPVISGGRRITGFQRQPDGTWSVVLPDVAAGRWDFHQLSVADRRAVRARHPNRGYLRVASPVAASAGGKAKDRFVYRPGDLDPGTDLSDATLVLYHSWTTSMHTAALDRATTTAQLAPAAPWPIGQFEANQRYHVENLRAALDQPGEWCLERRTGRLTYLPREGEDPTQVEVVAPLLRQLVVLAGDAAAGLPVSGLTFRGFALRDTDWASDTPGLNDGQAGMGLWGSISATDATGCRFEGLDGWMLGGYALRLGQGCQDNVVVGCHFHDLAGGGIRVGDPARNLDSLTQRNTIENCYIHHAGLAFPGSVGILVINASHTVVQHNEVSDLYYTGISVGWSWGYADSLSHHNLIEHNLVHHVGWGLLSDLGGIYTLGVSPGTRISGNVIHEIQDYRGLAFGIYLDEGSTGITIEGNVVYNTASGGFHQHYGRENVVQNNVFAFARQEQIRRSRAEDHLSFTFRRNILLDDQAETLAGAWDDGRYAMDGNLYWRLGGQPTFAGKSWADWQAAGRDQHSVVADPGFVDLAVRDFRLLPTSPALRLGFQPIDPTEAGLTGDARWTALPRAQSRPPMDYRLAGADLAATP